jgi:hypothetical protein
MATGRAKVLVVALATPHRRGFRTGTLSPGSCHHGSERIRQHRHRHDNTVDDELVGRGLCDQFADRYAVALAYDERGKLAKFAQTKA